MPLGLGPRMEVVGAGCRLESSSVGELDVVEQLARRILFVRSVVAESRHAVLQGTARASGCAARSDRLVAGSRLRLGLSLHLIARGDRHLHTTILLPVHVA